MNCEWLGPVADSGLDEYNLEKYDKIDLETCQLNCEERDDCLSIDWKPTKLKCSLNSKTQHEVALTTAANVVYYEKQKCKEKGKWQQQHYLQE